MASAPGDLFVSLETGPVLWRLPDGTARGVLLPTIAGTGEGMDFDLAGNLHVARWCVDSSCRTGNTVEKFNVYGLSQGAVGEGYDCAPHAIVFDRAGPSRGTAYVGQAGCRGSILKFAPGATSPTAEFAVTPDQQGAFWIDLAPDSCTIFYTSFGPNVKRFDVCTHRQLPDFNQVPLPGGIAQDVRVLSDGGVLVASGDAIARLNSAGVLVGTYAVPGEDGALWAGLDLAGDGTFWAGNYFSSNVYRFDLTTGAVLWGFNTGTPANTVVGIRVRK
jgi:outer membrane protein assembly factor BamB